MDFSTQINSYRLTQQYDKLMSRSDVKSFFSEIELWQKKYLPNKKGTFRNVVKSSGIKQIIVI